MKKQNAFSLVEIMIVVAIIGLLVAIAVPNYYTAKQRDGLARVLAPHGTVQPGVTEMGNNWYYFNPGTNSAFVMLSDWAESHSNLVFAAGFLASQNDYGNYAHSYAVKETANHYGITNGYFAVFFPK